MYVDFDVDRLASHVTEIRDIAESVRTYGGGERFGEIEISSALHVIAGRLESEMRRWAFFQHMLMRTHPAGGNSGQDVLRFDNLKAVLTYRTPVPVSVDVRKAELDAAATRLRVLAEQLPAALSTWSTDEFVSLLMGQADVISASTG